jgi:hypothetical protein
MSARKDEKGGATAGDDGSGGSDDEAGEEVRPQHGEGRAQQAAMDAVRDSAGASAVRGDLGAARAKLDEEGLAAWKARTEAAAAAWVLLIVYLFIYFLVSFPLPPSLSLICTT